MPSSASLCNSFRAAGTNRSLDLCLTWQASKAGFKTPCSIWFGSECQDYPKRVSLLLTELQLVGCMEVRIGVHWSKTQASRGDAKASIRLMQALRHQTGAEYFASQYAREIE